MLEYITFNWAALTLAITITACIALALRFERTANPKTIALIGMLTALTVVSRQLLHSLGEFSPVFMLVTLAGSVYGSSTGFMLGASTILLSNFMLGHGPWTPYQMLGLGLTGFFAGFIPSNRKRLTIILLIIYTVLSAYAYGLITDLFWWSAFSAEPSITTYIAVVSAGLPMDTARATGNVLFMLALGRPLLRVLERFRKRLSAEVAPQTTS
ncbi:MAG: ECF transporter S component [Candidatus Altiarchaeota archaeon]|nr:ECF transporter S component [Candidatus Altiarchaeota archaeon]